MNQYATMREPIANSAGSPFDDHPRLLFHHEFAGDQAGVLIGPRLPMVGWIWGAVLMMGVGGLIALIPMRRRTYVVVPERAPEIDSEVVA
jgi:cytochrome c biogenesis factor